MKNNTKADFIKNELFYHRGCGLGDYRESGLPSKDNLYLINIDYHSYYDDDDCYFTYINAETGEVEHDSWTTRGACPCWDSYVRMDAREALEKGYLSQEKFDAMCTKFWNTYVADFVNKVTHDAGALAKMIYNELPDGRIGMTCKVSSRSRKFNGTEGVVLGYKPVWDKWNEEWCSRVKVMGMDFKIYTVRPDHVQIDMETIRTKMYEVIGQTDDLASVLKLFPAMNLSTEGMVDVEEQEKWNKFYEVKAQKMPGLIEWCKDKKPDDTPDQIFQWASSIFNRKYDYLKP